MRSIGTATLLTGGLLAVFASASTVAAEESVHVVKPGQTLAGIAQERLGDASRWKEIARLNDLKPPYKIAVGQKLRLPQGGAAFVVVAPEPSGAAVSASSRPSAGSGSAVPMVMFIMAVVLLAASMFAGTIGFIWFEVVAFRECIWWGLATFLLYPVQIVFLILYWKKAWRSFALQVLAAVVGFASFGGLILASSLFGVGRVAQ